tara:strand:+ start:25438 stop:25761 length:324 start_codon:yes stop_codon:yes gene_type:complete
MNENQTKTPAQFAKTGIAKDDRRTATLMMPPLPRYQKTYPGTDEVAWLDDWDTPQGEFRSAMIAGDLRKIQEMLPAMLEDPAWSLYHRAKWLYRINILLQNDGLPTL